MNDEIVFVDSNIWLYSLFVSPNSTKRQIATQLIEKYKPILSYQVIQEVCANLIKKEKADLQKLHTILQGFQDYTIVPTSLDLVRQALDLIERYQVSYWDCSRRQCDDSLHRRYARRSCHRESADN